MAALENVPLLLRRMCTVLLLGGAFFKHQLDQEICILTDIYIPVLSIIWRGVLKSPAIIVDLSIYPVFHQFLCCAFF